MADSGNGAHLLYPIDIPVADTGLIEHCLDALATEFGSLDVEIDRTVHNPARFCRLYGTVACKGDCLPTRPHRLAQLLAAPDTLIPVSRELLESLAAAVKIQTVKTPTPMVKMKRDTMAGFDLPGWITRHQLDVSGPAPYQGGQQWVFKTCPWNPEHTNGSAFILQLANGAIAAGCHPTP